MDVVFYNVNPNSGLSTAIPRSAPPWSVLDFNQSWVDFYTSAMALSPASGAPHTSSSSNASSAVTVSITRILPSSRAPRLPLSTARLRAWRPDALHESRAREQHGGIEAICALSEFEGVLTSGIKCLMLACCMEKKGPLFATALAPSALYHRCSPIAMKPAGFSACDYVLYHVLLGKKRDEITGHALMQPDSGFYDNACRLVFRSGTIKRRRLEDSQ